MGKYFQLQGRMKIENIQNAQFEETVLEYAVVILDSCGVIWEKKWFQVTGIRHVYSGTESTESIDCQKNKRMLY